MKLKFNKYYLLLALVVIAACEKEELPVAAHNPGDVISAQVEMGNDYRNQLFYDLGTNSVVSQNLKTDWDLGFEGSTEGWHIILNTSRGGAAANMGTTDFVAVNDTTGVVWANDFPSGNLDSTAIGDYQQTGNVYVINRGYNSAGGHTGLRKLVIEEVTTTSYTIRYAMLDGNEEMTMEIPKDSTVNFVAFSFNTHEVVPIQPPKNDWDLLFTQYTHIFLDPPTTYLVTGALSNRHNVAIAIDTLNEFSTITYENISDYNFSGAINTIGYDWKIYGYISGTYTVFTNINYIIKDTEGRYFKLHFIDFYNEAGEKGAPKFEMQEL